MHRFQVFYLSSYKAIFCQMDYIYPQNIHFCIVPLYLKCFLTKYPLAILAVSRWFLPPLELVLLTKKNLPYRCFFSSTCRGLQPSAASVEPSGPTTNVCVILLLQIFLEIHLELFLEICSKISSEICSVLSLAISLDICL